MIFYMKSEYAFVLFYLYYVFTWRIVLTVPKAAGQTVGIVWQVIKMIFILVRWILPWSRWKSQRRFDYIIYINELETYFGKTQYIENSNLNSFTYFLISHLFSIHKQFFVTDDSHSNLHDIKRQGFFIFKNNDKVLKKSPSL